MSSENLESCQQVLRRDNGSTAPVLIIPMVRVCVSRQAHYQVVDLGQSAEHRAYDALDHLSSIVFVLLLLGFVTSRFTGHPGHNPWAGGDREVYPQDVGHSDLDIGWGVCLREPLQPVFGEAGARSVGKDREPNEFLSENARVRLTRILLLRVFSTVGRRQRTDGEVRSFDHLPEGIRSEELSKLMAKRGVMIDKQVWLNGYDASYLHKADFRTILRR